MFNINGTWWELVFCPWDSEELITDENEYTIGMCDSWTKTIYLNENLDGEELRKVLCHELVHASCFSYGVNLTRDQEELIADILSTYGAEIIEKTNLIFEKIKMRRLVA